MIQALILVGTALLVGLDQWTKVLAVTHLEDKAAIPLIKGVFELEFTTNPGVAFGLFPGATIITVVLTSLAMLALLIVLMSGKLNQSKMIVCCGTLILGGGIGNLIDRIFRPEGVVDFLYFKLINFPIFNVADCCVVIGACLLLVYFLFVYKEKKPAANEESSGVAGEEAVQIAQTDAPEHQPVVTVPSDTDTSAGQDGGEA